MSPELLMCIGKNKDLMGHSAILKHPKLGAPVNIYDKWHCYLKLPIIFS